MKNDEPRFSVSEGRDSESLDRFRDSGLRATVCVPKVVEVSPGGIFWR